MELYRSIYIPLLVKFLYFTTVGNLSFLSKVGILFSPSPQSSFSEPSKHDLFGNVLNSDCF